MKLMPKQLARLSLLALATGAPAPAQDQPPPPNETLERLAGEWTRTTRFQWQGQWHEEHATAKREWVLGGSFLRERLVDARGEVEGLRFLSVVEDGFELVSLDGMSPGATVLRGAGTPDELELRGEEKLPWSEKPIAVRWVLRIESEDRHVLEIRADQEGEERLIMEAIYRRATPVDDDQKPRARR